MKLIFNGKMYASIDEMPSDVRQFFRPYLSKHGQALELAGMELLAAQDTSPARIVINGREYQSVDEMPPEHRRLYEQVAYHAAGEGHCSGTQDHLEPGGSVRIATDTGPQVFSLSLGKGTWTVEGRATLEGWIRRFGRLITVLTLVLVLAELAVILIRLLGAAP